MFTDPNLTLADQIFWIVDVFLKTLAPEACKLRIGSVSGVIWNRVRKFERQFLALYAQWKAGTLPKARARSSAARSFDRGEAQGEGEVHPPPRPSPSRGEGELPAAVDAGKIRPASALPRGRGWLNKMLPLSAGTLASRLGPLLLEHPEMKTFVAEVPRVGRLLRPICRMVGMEVPEWLALPKRKKVTSPRPSPHGGEGEGKKARGLSAADEEELRRITARFPDTPPARAAKRVWRRMFEGKPVNLRRLSAVALGYVLHAPRDGNCPPPEIGYGGRSFPRLPKDYVPPKDWD